MLRVGITGGIGSGKSTVARLFELLGVPVYYADEQAKALMNSSEVIRRRIIESFGERAYNGGQLDRAYLAGAVFNDPPKLALLNSIVHPEVIAYGKAWMEAQQSPYVLKEAALFFESGSAAELDYIIGVWAPAELRIQRVQQRDGSSRDEILSRMRRQIDENIKMKLCDFVISNDESRLVIPQVLELHERLLSMAGQGVAASSHHTSGSAGSASSGSSAP